MPSCQLCKRPLKNEESIRIGMGPVCRAKSGYLEETEKEEDDLILEEDLILTDAKYNELISLKPFELKGERESRSVYIDGQELFPGPSQAAWNHSPDGFMWGYGGSGPAQLALAVLLHFINNRKIAVTLHQSFKWEQIATLPQSDFTVTIDIGNWLKKNLKQELIEKVS